MPDEGKKDQETQDTETADEQEIPTQQAMLEELKALRKEVRGLREDSGGSPEPATLDEAIAQARKDGDFERASRLKTRKLLRLNQDRSPTDDAQGWL